MRIVITRLLTAAVTTLHESITDTAECRLLSLCRTATQLRLRLDISWVTSNSKCMYSIVWSLYTTKGQEKVHVVDKFACFQNMHVLWNNLLKSDFNRNSGLQLKCKKAFTIDDNAMPKLTCAMVWASSWGCSSLLTMASWSAVVIFTPRRAATVRTWRKSLYFATFL